MFQPHILARGKNYYESGRVVNFAASSTTCHAVVRGTEKYHVTINADRNGRYMMSCSCPHSRDGHLCKHIAAVMYRWKEGEPGTSANRPAVNINLWPEGYFNQCWYKPDKALKNCTVSADSYREAVRILQEHEYGPADIREKFIGGSYDSRRCIEAEMYAQTDEDQPHYVYMMLTRDSLERAYCTKCSRSLYSYHSGRNDLCEHLTALAIETGDYIRANNPGDETDISGQALLNSYRTFRARLKEDENPAGGLPITLEPRIIENGAFLSAAFRIGSGKLYLLKDVTELVTASDEGASLALGRGNTLHFTTDRFDEQSVPYFDFIKRRVSETNTLNEMLRRRSGYYSGEISLKNSIELNGVALDEFYDIAEGKTFELENRNDKTKKRITFKPEPFKYELHIEKILVDGKFEGLQVSGRPLHILSGAKHHYCFYKDHLGRLSEEDYRLLEPLIRIEDYHGVHMRIGRRRLSEFYYRVLPILKQNPMITVIEEEPELIHRSLPPEAKLTFYLDAENERLLCRGEAQYDTQQFVLRTQRPGDDAPDAYRDLELEQQAMATIRNYFPWEDPETGVFVQDKDDDAVYELLDSGLKELLALGDVQASEAFRRLRIRRTPMIRIGVSVESSLLDLEIATQDMTPEELLAVLDSYRRKKKFHRLSSGEFIALEQNDSLDMLAQMMDSMSVSLRDFVKGRLHLPLYRALFVNKLLEEHDSVAADRDRHFRNLVRSFNAINDSDYDVPETLKDTLRTYQVYGYKWLRTLAESGFGGILADDMGLGKTIQVIAVLQAVKNEGRLHDPALVICPASVVYNWEAEFKRFAPGLKAVPVTGTSAGRSDILHSGADVFITSYDLLKRDIGLYEDMHFSYQILDEAQFVKNPRAAVSRSVRIIHSDHRIALTGTPIENRLSELWSIFDYLMPGFLYSYEDFRSRFETPITRSRDEIATEQLRRMVSPFILRRLKEDVLKDLPEKLEEIRYAGFDEEQQKLYDGQVVRMREMIASLDQNSGENKIRILAEMTRIRQICCDPSLLVDGYTGGSAKREACLDLIRSAVEGGHKMLVFSQFTSMLELLEEDLHKEDIPYYKITGATSKEDRMKFVQQFNTDETPVFLISLKAGGTGLNLTGADVVIHYDPWWNLAAQNQATDRAHRIGQTKKVNVFRLIVRDTIEERILEMQAAKKDLADSILTGEMTSLGSLSKEELLELLS